MEKTVLIALSEDERTSAIARAIISREAEIFAYELNISNYDAMLADPLAAPELRAQITATLKTEHVEHGKALAFYRAMKAQLPEATLAKIVLAEKAKIIP